MKKQLTKILKEAGISSDSIGKYLDEYREVEEKLHKECEIEQEQLKGNWLGDSNAAENTFHDCLEHAPINDRLKRRGIWSAYDSDEFYLYTDYKTGLKNSRKRHKIGELRKIIEILDRTISNIDEEFKERDFDEEYFNDEYKLVAFDVDGTLVDSVNLQNVWVVLNKEFKTSDEDYQIEKRYQSGEITYQEWVSEILSLYVKKGANKQRILRAIEPIKPVIGVQETIQKLKESGKKLAVISGSLDIILDKVFPDNPFDYIEINKLYFDDNGNIKRWNATPYGDGRGKALGLMNLSRDSLKQSVYVGDGMNDKEAIEVAGLGIAFYPYTDSFLRKYCDVEIERKGYEKKDLRKILRHIL